MSKAQRHPKKSRVTLLGMPEYIFIVQGLADGKYTLRGLEGTPTILAAADQVLAVPKVSPKGEAAAARLKDALGKPSRQS